MPVKLRKTRIEEPSLFRRIFFLSAWGFILAVASLLFLWVGSLLDQLLGTSPKLMLGLFFLAVVGCFIELVDEVRKMLKGK
ncbi:MAG: AtpZ/AtpI family protein [Syntrophaceae bacterium]|jgi:hypothetical protein|nr:AtpZ/AtpI family protein [Syntrophaceae bacterium]